MSPNSILDHHTSSAAAIEIQLLGTFQVRIDGRPLSELAWRQRRAAEIVKLLALEPTHRLQREQLIDTLWPAFGVDAGLNNLRQALYHARHQFRAAGMPAGAILRRQGDTIILANPDDLWVDVHAFETAARPAMQSLSPDPIRAALELYAGDLLPDDLYAPWAEPLRTELRARYVGLLTRLGNLHLERGEPGQAIDVLQRLTRADPTREPAHRALMHVLAQTGQREMALAQYERLVEILREELDVEPEPATRELARDIANGTIQVAFRSPPAPRGMQPASALPVPVSSIIGRSREVNEIVHLLSSGRLVTLTGPGGIGKTRLALEVARALIDSVPDGVIFVDLAPLSGPELVASTIASAVGVRELGGQRLEATLSAFLRDKHVLLILDNFEHVLGAAPSIALLLENTPNLKILATSRVRLRLRGEVEFSVPPLAITGQGATGSTADAITLFVARSRTVRPDFRLTDENAATVEAICRRLAGLPLAIELAAARSRLLAPQAILDRLAQPLTLLTAGPADLPARQQAIRATIQWSVDLLDHEQRATFVRLSVFSGGWTLDGAEMVAADVADPTEVLNHLEFLVDSNLVTRQTQPDGEVRFGMLETIREFGLEQLTTSNEEDAVRDRHAVWIIHLIRQAEEHLEGPEQAVWLARLEREDDNIRAALAWLRERGDAESALRLSRALRLHWFVRGRLSEGLKQLEATLGLPEVADYPLLHADALTATSFLAREAGDYQRAYDATRASLAISHQIRDRKRAADALVNLGYIALQRGQIDDARALLQRSLTTHRELGNEQGIADTVGFLALTDLQRRDFGMAARRLEQSLAIWSALDDLQGVAWARAQLGLVRLEQKAFRASWDELMASLSIAEMLDFRGDVYMVVDGLARLAATHDLGALAVRLSAVAASIREQSGIQLSPLDEARSRHFLEELKSLTDDSTIARCWSRRHDWQMAEIIESARESIEPLLPDEETT